MPEAAARTLIFDLQRMNANAYAARYGKRTPKVQPLTLDPDTEPLTPIALINVLRDHVIDQLPEYNKAEWFIDSPPHTV